jgi:hypothetical protein
VSRRLGSPRLDDFDPFLIPILSVTMVSVGILTAILLVLHGMFGEIDLVFIVIADIVALCMVVCSTILLLLVPQLYYSLRSLLNIRG